MAKNQWTKILRRQDGSVDFNRNWMDYKLGFGNPDADFFIGLEMLHRLTSNGKPKELLVVLVDYENETRFARYDKFRIGSESEKYAITELGTYSGDAGDGMGWHRGRKFTTFDQDNNAGNIRDCPQYFKGGWWFHDPCYSGLDTLEGDLKKSCQNSQKWTTIQRRQDDSVHFNRSWNEYDNGFGNPDGNYFMGLQRIYELTNFGGPQELLIILKDFNGVTRYAKYERFRIGSEEEKYALLDVGGYSGDAGNSFEIHKGNAFSTYDRDNDNSPDRNNAVIFQGGWWFFGLGYHGYLNGPYRQESESNNWGISWHDFRMWNRSLKYAQMMIRTKC
ncbi:angiopoietin-related protein 6-like [Musca vetustissima]|uniref:angiopoietin-related protein 6-like n=1 Tax=Musca vetustissima TaxID=27455 RepID=UPI002AB5DF05|nr:angiopoietin-related protein 6-like [Musca vetustissima]